MLKLKVILLLLITLLASEIQGTSQISFSYYFPKNESFDPSVPTPADVLGYQVGDWHASHDQLLAYFRKLAEVSPRVKYEVYGKTHEGRPMTVAIISSEENIKNIEEIRKEHLKITDPSASGNLDLSGMPVVVWLSHSIHGNEASGANSSMLTAYYYAASTGKEVEELLKSTIILIDPATNPDGLQRFSDWANSNKSYQTNTDPLSREHIEAWPGGRSNHYWFDLNRDWLPIEQPESEARVKKLLEWKPNVLVDLHEMGSNSTFHFSPGEPKRVNPLIPAENQDLTRKLAEGYAKAYDAIGSLYFSAEQYDDYYIGRGPTFMDMNGGVSLLFEQASSRGFAQVTDNGLLTFSFAIRNQLTGAISSVNTASRLGNEFLTYQRNYYVSALNDAKKSLKKAYIFGTEYDRNTTFRLAGFLEKHGIKSYLTKKDIVIGKKVFKTGNAYVVPLEQPQNRLIESIFETRTTFADSIFYDVSAWNMPMAYNLQYETLDAKFLTPDLKGEPFSASQATEGKITGNSPAYAYIMKWEDYYSPDALYKLLKEDIIVKVATSPVETLDGKIFDRGSIIIPLGTVNADKVKVDKIVSEITRENGIDVMCLSTGDNKKFDLGSPTLVRLRKPNIVILTDEGVNANSAGQLWHLLDTRYKIPATLLPVKQLNTADLNNYNVLILPDGNYQAIDEAVTEKIRNWVSAGNTLIACEKASNWLNKTKFIQVEFLKNDSKKSGLNYEENLLFNVSREIPGTIFEVQLDLTHPLCYGYKTEKIAMYKDNDLIQNISDMSPLSYPAIFTKSPLLDGYSPKGFEKSLSGTPAFGVFPYRQGRVIALYNNLNFRGYWWGTNRILANSIFFADVIRFSAGGMNQ